MITAVCFSWRAVPQQVGIPSCGTCPASRVCVRKPVQKSSPYPCVFGARGPPPKHPGNITEKSLGGWSLRNSTRGLCFFWADPARASAKAISMHLYKALAPCQESTSHVPLINTRLPCAQHGAWWFGLPMKNGTGRHICRSISPSNPWSTVGQTWMLHPGPLTAPWLQPNPASQAATASKTPLVPAAVWIHNSMRGIVALCVGGRVNFVLTKRSHTGAERGLAAKGLHTDADWGLAAKGLHTSADLQSGGGRHLGPMRPSRALLRKVSGTIRQRKQQKQEIFCCSEAAPFRRQPIWSIRPD